MGTRSWPIQELSPKSDSSGAQFDAAAHGSGDAGGGLKSLSRTAKDGAEAEAISKALDETNWNRKQAAVLLKISYKALLYKIRQYGIAQSKSHKLSAGAVEGSRVVIEASACPQCREAGSDFLPPRAQTRCISSEPFPAYRPRVLGEGFECNGSVSTFILGIILMLILTIW